MRADDGAHEFLMMPLPHAFARIPLRVSIVPMRGCVHFCSFCADNSGKRAMPYPFRMLRDSLLNVSFPLQSAALYNACDGLAYRWTDGKRTYTALNIIEILKKRGCKEFLISSPGIACDAINAAMLREVARDNSISLMLSFNREHILHPQRMRDFYWTAKTILEYRRIVVRLVYCTAGEKTVLMNELSRMFGKELLHDPITRRGLTLETVPALPLGRGRAIYFGNAPEKSEWRNKVETMILQMFREEPHLRDVRYMTQYGYDDFLLHAAVQFAGMFIIAFEPSSSGIDIFLKMTDPKKIAKTNGMAIATPYRFDERVQKFSHVSPSGERRMLDFVMVDVTRCALSDFIRYCDRRIPPAQKQNAARLYTAFLSSDILLEKCAINDSVKMLPLNVEYLRYFQRSLEAMLASRGVHNRHVNMLFPVIMDYLIHKGTLI